MSRERVCDTLRGVIYERWVPASDLRAGDIIWTPFGYRARVVDSVREGVDYRLTIEEESGERAGETYEEVFFHRTTTTRFERFMTSAERGLS